MKQIFETGKRNKTFVTAMPTPGDLEILVEVYSSIISTGTETMGMKDDDLQLSEKIEQKKEILTKVLRSVSENGFKATIEAIKEKVSPSATSAVYKAIGYSNAGIVVAKGRSVTGFNAGDRVACAGAGFASHAEYAAVPINLAVRIPVELEFESACFASVGAIAMQGIRRANVTFGETIVITGLGLLGLLSVQIAKAWGLVVIGTDINSDRLDLANKLGADHCFDSKDANFVQKVNSVTNGFGADAVIIYAAAKSSEPANLALKACRKKGRVVIVGSVGMDLEREAMYSKELDFVMSTSYGPGRYDSLYELKGIDYPIGYVRWTENRNMSEFIRLLAEGRINVKPLISNSYEIDKAEEAYKSLVENAEGNISAVFKYRHEQKTLPSEIINKQKFPIKEGQIGVGIIGAGGFVQRTHLANLLEMPEDYKLAGIAQKTPASAKTVSERYKVGNVTTDYRQLLSIEEINLIVIGTRHNLHAQQVVDSIKAGKDVLVEKPLAMNDRELMMIVQAFNENPELIIAVGFNRRYSPLIQYLRTILEGHKTPMVVNYRVNAGFIAPDSWVQDPDEGGGRIIGEVCHFLDLIVYITSGKVIAMDAIHVPCNGDSIRSEDNLIVSLKFDNGSIGVLSYTSIGGKQMEKERIEVFSGGSSFVLNDFRELQTFNCDIGGMKLKRIDKGHKALIRELSNKMRGKSSLLLPFEADIEVTRLTLEVLNRIHHLGS